MYKEEMKIKPEDARVISESGGLASPEEVAKSVVQGLKKWKFEIFCTTDGALLGKLFGFGKHGQVQH